MKLLPLTMMTGLVLLTPLPALSQHSGHNKKAMSDASPATKEYKAANDKMHKDMNIPYSGNADEDFVKGMIAHHQGAIDMANIVIKHGKDKKIAVLARRIIKSQETEIVFMKNWLNQRTDKKHNDTKSLPSEHNHQ